MSATGPGTGSDTTDGSGYYEILDLPAGAYTVTASATYFDSQSCSATVVAGQTTTVDFWLFGDVDVYVISPDLTKVCFNSADPGVAELACAGYTTPLACYANYLQWTTPGIPGSTKSWIPASAIGAEVTLKFTGLPPLNSSFGGWGAFASVDGRSSWDVYRLFFAEEATNHPDGVTPNWFYYWRQTTASYGAPHYSAAQSLGSIHYENNTWLAYLGANTNEAYTPPEGDNGGNQLDGIDSFAWQCRHEARHAANSNVWYPNNWDASKDGDKDWIPDNLEAGFGGTQQNPINGGPFTPGVLDTDRDGLRDDEDYTCHTQPAWTEGSADDEDWAHPGKQWP